MHAKLAQKFSLLSIRTPYSARNVSVRLPVGAPGPELARLAQGRARLRRYQPGSGPRARRRSLTAPPTPDRRTAVQRWSARVARHVLPTLSSRCPAGNECSVYQYGVYTESPDAQRCIIASFQPSAVSGPQAPSTVSITAKGDQTVSRQPLVRLGTRTANAGRGSPARVRSMERL